MKRQLFIIITLFSFYSAFSQKADTSGIFDTRTFTFSYFGNNLLKPGIKIGTNITLMEKRVVKRKTKRNKTIVKSTKRQLLAGANAGFFWHPESHIGAFNFYALTYRTINLKSGSYRKIGIGPGIYRSFYPKTYKFDETTGQVNKIALGGRTYFAPVFIFGTGKFIKNSFFQSRTFTTNLMFLYDYNSGIVPLLNFEVGLCFDFKNKHI